MPRATRTPDAPHESPPATGRAATAPRPPQPRWAFRRDTPRRWARQVLVHAPAGLVATAVVALGSAPVAIAWYAASRLGYVLFVGFALSLETSRRALSREVGADAAWGAFRSRVSWLMDNDAAAFLALAVTTASTFEVGGVPPALVTVAGVALTLLGFGVKIWATASLPEGAYHWRNFFIRGEAHGDARGPYRFLSDPMYTIGYAHAYGVALLLRSVPGLLAAVTGQALMLLLNVLVETRAHPPT